MNGAVAVDALEHPAQAELLRGDPVVVGEDEPAVVEVDVDQGETGLDPQHHQRVLAERAQAVAPPRPRGSRPGRRAPGRAGR